MSFSPGNLKSSKDSISLLFWANFIRPPLFDLLMEVDALGHFLHADYNFLNAKYELGRVVRIILTLAVSFTVLHFLVFTGKQGTVIPSVQQSYSVLSLGFMYYIVSSQPSVTAQFSFTPSKNGVRWTLRNILQYLKSLDNSSCCASCQGCGCGGGMSLMRMVDRFVWKIFLHWLRFRQFWGL